MLTSLPLYLLSSAVSYLHTVSDVLLFHRLCHSFHYLRSDADWCAVAWQCTTAYLFLDDETGNALQRLINTTLPSSRHVRMAPTAWPDERIPAKLWQDAKDTLTTVAQRWLEERPGFAIDDSREHGQIQGTRYRVESVQQLLDLLRSPQETEMVTDVEGVEVEVLKDVHHSTLSDAVEWSESSIVLSNQLLSCLPHLQQLLISIDAIHFDMPPISASIAHVPHLRVLHVQQTDSDQTNTEHSLLDIRATLDALPQLRVLHWLEMRVSILDLLHIAAHSTLEDITIESVEYGVAYDDREWLGSHFHFKRQGAELDKEDPQYPDTEPVEEVEGEEGGMSELEANELKQRLLASLIRTKPTLHAVYARRGLIKLLRASIHPHNPLGNVTEGMIRRRSRCRARLVEQYEHIAYTMEVSLQQQLRTAMREEWPEEFVDEAIVDAPHNTSENDAKRVRVE